MRDAHITRKEDTDWSFYGTVEIAGEDRSIWSYVTREDKEIFNVTTGDVPVGNGGYYDLEPLLEAKGVSLRDVRRPGQEPPAPSFGY